jgi:hypothetical protein
MTWHQHSSICDQPVSGDTLVEVWPVGDSEPHVAEAAAVDWSRPLRWRFLALEPIGTTTASSLLNKAAELMAERGRQYDKPDGERSMGRAVAAFNSITGRDLSEAEGWLLLQVLKDVRQWQRPGYHADSAEDCIAYAALKAEALCRKADER